MTTLYYVFAGLALVLLALVAYTMLKKEKETIVKIRSRFGAKSNSLIKAPSNYYVAKKRKGTSGKSRSDWDFYDDNDSLIYDVILMIIIFDTFVDGDWDLNFDYYVEDVEYYSNKEVMLDDIDTGECHPEGISGEPMYECDIDGLEDAINEDDSDVECDSPEDDSSSSSYPDSSPSSSSYSDSSSSSSSYSDSGSSDSGCSGGDD